MRRTIRLGIICLVAVFNVGRSQELPREFAFGQISIPGTISSSQVTGIIQDDAGIIWFAGHGLFRYDGFGFRQYRQLADGAGDLNPYDIHSLLQDSAKKRILMGTQRFGLISFDQQTDRLHRLPSAGVSPIINHLARTSDGKIWGSSLNHGLFFVENDTLKEMSHPEYAHPSCLLADGSTLYMAAEDKVLVLSDGVVQEEISLAFQGKVFPSDSRVSALCIDREKRLWIGTQKDGILVYDLRNKTVVRHFAPSTAPFFSKITQIIQDRDGLIWILTKANGLVVYSPGTDDFRHLVKDRLSPRSISSDNCFSVLEDREGMIWVGTTGDLSRYDRRQIKFRHIFHDSRNGLTLTDNMVRGVYEDIDGRIWVGTDGGYINMMDLKNQRSAFHKVTIAGDANIHIPHAFLNFDRHSVLVGTTSGLLRWDRAARTLLPFRPLWHLTQGKNIRQILKKGNTLYFLSNGDLYIHDLSTGGTEVIETAGDSLAFNLSAIYLDHSQRLWVGSSKGVSLYNEADKNFRFFSFHLPETTEGSLLLVLSIEQIRDELYIGTFNAGLWRMSIADTGAISPPENFNYSNGLQTNTVYATLPDDHGRLWMSTNHGIIKFEPESRQFFSFSVSEGLQGDEYNRLAFTRTRAGELIFGGINGINIFHPAGVAIEKENFSPVILSVTVRHPFAKQEQITRFSRPAKDLVLRHDQNFLDIDFFVPHYGDPRRYALFYKLDNFDQDWKEAVYDNTADYANLPPGNYTFRLKSVSINGDEQMVSLPVTISWPYWKRWWFILLLLCIVMFFVMTIIRSYVRKAESDRRRLQDLLRIRTSEIEKSREELHSLNQKKDLIFSILSHDLRGPLTTLKGFLGYLVSHAEELSTEDLRKHAVNIKNSVSNSLDLLDNTLFWSLSQMGNIQYTPADFSLFHLLEKLKGLYQLTADKKRIRYTITCPPDLYIHGDENMIYVTLRNLVSNALKFTAEGNTVTVECSRTDGFAEIRVIDEGIGMSEEYQHKILSRHQPMLKKGTSNEKGAGLGLLLCIKFIELNKGQLLIKSAEQEGTTFTVRLPLAINQPALASDDNP